MSVNQLKSLVLSLCKTPLFSSQVRLQPSYRVSRHFTQSVRRLQDEDEETEGSAPVSEKQKRFEVDHETSIQYLDSKAYKQCYGEDPVWKLYRRNFKGQLAPKTRKTCIRANVISTGNPCPVCRDDHLLVDYRNVKLLNQFISPHTGQVLDSMDTGVCQTQQKKLILEIFRARDYGYLEDSVPFRQYNYKDYY
ncbi:28S ribosomal protein S18b, mitochondrial [Patella vulgata]|uniref:28S ribosomal protein S18b, mitochondrial n=1 Tax=Patella vulgata TaxID=6465 RepID=UPI00217FDA1A|nr:28S ribosomal protein S18b, mitochondrial [Patella vulgata]